MQKKDWEGPRNSRVSGPKIISGVSYTYRLHYREKYGISTNVAQHIIQRTKI